VEVKQQYKEVVEQYRQQYFIGKEQQSEVDALSNSISEVYASLRESFADLVLSWEGDLEGENNQEKLDSMIRDQIKAYDNKNKKDTIRYSLQGIVRNEGVERFVQYVGEIDKMAYNVSGKERFVRKFVLNTNTASETESDGDTS
jgi:hypothetical protein